MTVCDSGQCGRCEEEFFEWLFLSLLSFERAFDHELIISYKLSRIHVLSSIEFDFTNGFTKINGLFAKVKT